MELYSQGNDLILETDHIEPHVLGAERTRQLYTYAYGMSLNGYTEKEIASNCRNMFSIDIDEMDIYHIIGSIDFEASIALRNVGII